YLDYQDWKRFSRSFRSLDIFTGDGVLVNGVTGAEPAQAGRVSASFFRTLGVTPLIGRDFAVNEETPGARVAMLSYGAWKVRFGGRKDITGQPVVLSGETHTIIGVLPEGFRFAPLGGVEFWTTIDPSGSCAKRRSCHNLYGVARLKPGVSIE